MTAEEALKKNESEAKAAKKTRAAADKAKAKNREARKASATAGKVITILRVANHPAGTISRAAWLVLEDFDGKPAESFNAAVAPICQGSGYLKEWARRGNISLT